MGVGVNIGAVPEDLPIPATSLENCGIIGLSSKELLAKFIDSFDKELLYWIFEILQVNSDVEDMLETC